MTKHLLDDRWLLPVGITEALPEQARQLEHLRRKILDVYQTWGYELVMPPFLEYLDSLLTGTGSDLAIQTFTVTDQESGRLLGVRADMTPQAARIDAHQLNRDVPTRLCYMGTVLKTRSDGFASTRSPLQIGAELYGHDGVESDVEIIELMLTTFELVGLEQVYLDLGHVGIFRSLVQAAGLTAQQENTLFDALQRKANPEIAESLIEWQVAEPVASALGKLTDLNGGIETIDRASEELNEVADILDGQLEELKALVTKLHATRADLDIHIDLAELRGYSYQTGMVFAAYVPTRGQEIARGGRYNNIGKDFGRERAATGFSTDLWTIASLGNAEVPQADQRVWAPSTEDSSLKSFVQSLRQQGNVVIEQLPSQPGNAADMGCTHEIVKLGNEWQVNAL